MSASPTQLRLRVFVSSVQKELADERMELKVLLSSDPFLVQHTAPCLFEQYPAPLRPDDKAYLKLLEKCQIYVLIIGCEYGRSSGFSATHLEYNRAQQLKLPTLVCVKGGNHFEREDKEKEFFEAVRADGHTYSRFLSLEELHAVVRERLIEHIQATYEISPSREQREIGRSSSALASMFEREQIADRNLSDLDGPLVSQLARNLDPEQPKRMNPEQRTNLLLQRGYCWFHPPSRAVHPTAAGLLLLGKDPTSRFPQCRVQLDIYPGRSRDDEATLVETVRGNVPGVIETIVRIIRANTRNTPRIVGLRRVELPEYPEVALREALVNALAHRDYEDPTHRVFVEVFFDRIVITNPGLPIGHPSLKRLEKGEARSRSRNPLLSQGLVFLGLMEERGTGIRRMRKAMLDHGLELPIFDADEDRFVLTLPGPADNLIRIKAPASNDEGLPKSLLEELNKRQLEILHRLAAGEELTTAIMQRDFSITRETVARDMGTLIELKLVQKAGKGRATRYLHGGSKSSGIVR